MCVTRLLEEKLCRERYIFCDPLTKRRVCIGKLYCNNRWKRCVLTKINRCQYNNKWLNKTWNALKTSALYISHDDDSCPHDKAICNRRMSNVHAKHDGSLGHHTFMLSSHSAWNSTSTHRTVQSLHVNPRLQNPRLNHVSLPGTEHHKPCPGLTITSSPCQKTG